MQEFMMCLPSGGGGGSCQPTVKWKCLGTVSLISLAGLLCVLTSFDAAFHRSIQEVLLLLLQVATAEKRSRRS